MPLIQSKNKDKYKQLRIKLKESTLKEIHDYQEWSGLHNFNDFVESAIEYIFKLDKDWIKKKKSSKIK